MPPMPPSPSPDHHRPGEAFYHKPHELDDINILIPNDIGPVSPMSNPDLVSVNPGDSKIITGGGSLNSTLSNGENGNQDLVKVLKEITKEQQDQIKNLVLIENPPNIDERMIDEITQDIFQNLIGDLKLDLGALLINDPRFVNQRA
jgi:hypothetical protein